MIRFETGDTPIKQIGTINLIVTLAVFVVAPAAIIWWLKSVMPPAAWWCLVPLYILWLLHFFGVFNTDEQPISTTDIDELPIEQPLPKPKPYTPPHNWKPPALIAQEKAAREQATVEVLEAAPAPKHFAQALSLGHEGIERCIRAGDWDTARLALQKVAYTMPNASPSEKAAFTEYMKQFAARDPLYKKVIEKALLLVTDEPGIKQTALYPRFPNVQPETIRYVLYFAEQLGHIKRIKKGNTYLLRMPGEGGQLG
jgi:hypothetical protein